MKPLLAAALALLGLPLLAQTDTTTSSTPTPPATAPTAPPPGAGGAGNLMQEALSTLTPEEKEQLNNDRLKAMAQNPDLQAEEATLMSKVMALQSSTSAPTAEQEHELGAEMKAHGDKVRAAMIQLDPSVEPVIAKLEAQVAKLRAQMGF